MTSESQAAKGMNTVVHVDVSESIISATNEAYKETMASSSADGSDTLNSHTVNNPTSTNFMENLTSPANASIVSYQSAADMEMDNATMAQIVTGSTLSVTEASSSAFDNSSVSLETPMKNVHESDLSVGAWSSTQSSNISFQDATATSALSKISADVQLKCCCQCCRQDVFACNTCSDDTMAEAAAEASIFETVTTTPPTGYVEGAPTFEAAPPLAGSIYPGSPCI